MEYIYRIMAAICAFVRWFVSVRRLSTVLPRHRNPFRVQCPEKLLLFWRVRRCLLRNGLAICRIGFNVVRNVLGPAAAFVPGGSFWLRLLLLCWIIPCMTSGCLSQVCLALCGFRGILR